MISLCDWQRNLMFLEQNVSSGKGMARICHEPNSGDGRHSQSGAGNEISCNARWLHTRRATRINAASSRRHRSPIYEVRMKPGAKLVSKQPPADPAHDVLRQERQPLDVVFAPKCVAVIGATERPGSVGRRVL